MQGLVTRGDFMDFIRNGGRRQRPQKAVPIERRLSIELDADKLEAGGPPISPLQQHRHAQCRQMEGQRRALNNFLAFVDMER